MTAIINLRLEEFRNQARDTGSGSSFSRRIGACRVVWSLP